MIKRLFAILLACILMLLNSAVGEAMKAYRIAGQISPNSRDGIQVFLTEIVNGEMQETPMAQAMLDEEGSFSFLDDNGDEVFWAPGLYAIYTTHEDQQMGSIQIFSLVEQDVHIVFELSEQGEDCDCL